MNLPDHIRNVALVGNIHHGKTSFLDLLINETHVLPVRDRSKQNEQLRYTDTHVLEQERGVTIKVSPMSLVLKNSKGKSFLVNVMDTPGHSNFLDEVSVASRYVDGFVLVVDVLEGLLTSTEQIISHAIREGLPLILVVNKIDRLILELKLPPNEAFYKIRYCIDQVNNFINKVSPFKNGKYSPLSPITGNVVFASSTCNFMFSLYTFALKYKENSPEIDAKAFAKRLWGDIFYNRVTRKFTKNHQAKDSKRSFEHFILEPLYKIFTHTLEEEKEGLEETLAKLNISLKPATYRLDVKPLLQTICSLFFGDSSAFVNALCEHIPAPSQGGSSRIVQNYYTGPKDGIEIEAMEKSDSEGPLVVHIAKLISTPNASGFYALGRVMSGTLNKGVPVSVLGENYSSYDTEDMQECVVSDLWIYQSRYKVPVDGVPAGNWALIGGVDPSIVKVATIFMTNQFPEEGMHIFSPIKYIGQPVFKVAVEPFNPSELPKLLDGLRNIRKSYSVVQTKAEESGEHVIIGTGELYMDCILYDLRNLHTNIQIKVSDPVAKFAETCLETSAIRAYTETPNKHNKITVIAEPLDPDIAADIEKGIVQMAGANGWTSKKVAKFFQEKYNWDAMSALSIWDFGPESAKENILQDDTLPDEVDKKAMKAIRESVKQGFKWAMRDGPLCDEPILNVKFKIIEAELSEDPSQRNSSQIISTARRACYSAFLLASPRLMEPLYFFEIIVNYDSVNFIKSIVDRRRGHVDMDKPISGTPLRIITGDIPVIDSVGFETDIRVVTQGSAFISALVFYKWSIVPGDPLDKSQIFRPLEVSPTFAMAREFVVKTRRRKGLSDEPTITKYLDESLLESLKETGLLDE